MIIHTLFIRSNGPIATTIYTKPRCRSRSYDHITQNISIRPAPLERQELLWNHTALLIRSITGYLTLIRGTELYDWSARQALAARLEVTTPQLPKKK